MKQNETKSPKITKSRNIILVIVFCLLLLLLQRCKERIRFDPKKKVFLPSYSPSNNLSVSIIQLEKERKNGRLYLVTALKSQVFGGVPPYSYQWKRDGVNFTTKKDILGDFNVYNAVSLVVTDSIGNTAIAEKTIEAYPFIAFQNPSATESGNFGTSNGSITINVLNEYPTYNYRWWDNATSNTHGGLSNRYVWVEINDSNGQYIGFYVVDGNINNIPLAFANYRQEDRFFTSGSPNERIVLIVSMSTQGSLETFTYAWTKSGVPFGDTQFAQTIFSLDRSIAHSYNVVATGSLGTTFNFNINVPIAQTKVINLSITNTNLGLPNGSVSIASLENISSNNLVYIQNTASGEVFTDLNNLAAGNYRMRILDKDFASVIEKLFTIL